MRLIYNDLHHRFRELIDQAERIDVAVAWSTVGTPLDSLMQFVGRQGSGALRLVTGIQGNATHPDALDLLHRHATLKIGERDTGRLFHPKLYIFHLGQQTVTWVGSANLTQNAFLRNSECVSEFEGALEDVAAYFEMIWAGAEESTDEFLSDYRSTWKPASQLREHFPSANIGDHPSTWLDHSSVDWISYLELIHAADRHWAQEWSSPTAGNWGVYSGEASWKNAILDFQRMLEISWDSLDKESATAILGTGGYNALFGAMTGHGKLRGLFASNNEEDRRAREKFRSLLSTIRDARSTGAAFVGLVSETYEALREAAPEDVNLASASVTRFLALTRPDVLISVNKGSARNLSRWSRIPQARLLTRSGYVQLIDWVMNQHWWASPRPEGHLEGELWDFRAALIDPFAWDGSGVSYSY